MSRLASFVSRSTPPERDRSNSDRERERTPTEKDRRRVLQFNFGSHPAGAPRRT